MTPPPPPTATATAGTLAPPRAPDRPRREPARRRPRPEAPATGTGVRRSGPRGALVGAGSGIVAVLVRAFSGRRLILLLGASLIGLVFLQVNLLRINTTMSADVEKAQMLQRDNASKRALIAQMGAGRRIEDAAAGLGMVMPAATEVCYLRIGRKSNCPDGLSAVSGDTTTEDGATATPPADSGATGDSAPGTAEAPAGDLTTEAAPAPQQAPAAPEPAPQEPASAGGMAAGPGGGG